jgi:hypothetical protein
MGSNGEVEWESNGGVEWSRMGVEWESNGDGEIWPHCYFRRPLQMSAQNKLASS